MKAVLALGDGTILHGLGFGAEAEQVGELVFNTSMMGYQEALTDPSYGGQILLMTYPLIGNYGINPTDHESGLIHARGFVVRELSADAEHRDSGLTADSFLKEHGIPGIHGIDTRFLVRHIREKGVMPAIIAASKNDSAIDPKKLLAKLASPDSFNYSKTDFVSLASTKHVRVFGEGGKKRVAMIDYGAKMGIVRELVARGCEVHLLPCHSTAEEVKAVGPDGILLSNGPGDPAILKDAHSIIRALGGYKPMFGICLGHQLIGHAFGGDTYKLKFGHRGSNHAVLDVKSGRSFVTTQNHGFAVGKIPEGFELTQVNANDTSVEGMRNDAKGIFSVQYHPEASPGPHDTRFLFDEFVKMM
ncbi:MAG: glutamine-hydrolyzing carbamoyl-phosphate synthase small subunit [Candidatus ainarchaeum sp.]|nr:glutamine-hydrolyzing carbamoyl-phosphate synthase small subunit [Candidatus ainarchaeum sp.]